MKLICISIFLTACLVVSCQTSNKAADFQKMEWLLGTWKGEADGQPFYENWERTGETSFKNINFSLCNGDTVVEGRSKIEIRDKKIVYASDNLTWELKNLSDHELVFENSRYGETFTFTKTEKGEWKARLKYPNSEVTYILDKTKSIAELLTTQFKPIEGNYVGHIEFNGKKLYTSIHFTNENGQQRATSSTPNNLQLNMPFRSVCVNYPFVKLTLQDGTKILTLNTKFEDKGNIENNILSGKLSGEIPATIYLEKQYIKDLDQLANYSIEALTIINGDIQLPASLYLPNSGTPTGAVIMVCGTGKHTKEEYNGWADLFATKGLAVLIYDKRNVTDFPHLNIRNRSSDLVLPGELESDVQSAINLLKSRKEIKADKIGLLGFSQGAVIVPVVAANNPDIAFVVAISGNTTTDKVFIIDQSLNRLRARNTDQNQIVLAEEIMNALFQYTKDGKNGKKIQKQLDEAYQSGFGQYALPRYLPNEDEMKFLSTWNSFDHDPAKYWSKLAMPCYIVYGDQDKVIPVEKSIVILKEIFARTEPQLTLKVYEGADHFIKNVPDRTNFDFPKFSNGYLEDLTNWIVEKAK